MRSHASQQVARLQRQGHTPRITKARKRLAEPCGSETIWALSVSPISGCPKAISGAPRIATLVRDRPADQCRAARHRRLAAHTPGASSWCQQPVKTCHSTTPATPSATSSSTPWCPCSAGRPFTSVPRWNRAWRAALKRVGRDLRKRTRRHPKIRAALLDLPLFVDRVVPFLSCSTREGRRDARSWAGLFRALPREPRLECGRHRARAPSIRRLLDKTPTSLRPDAADVESWERDLRRRGFPEKRERDDDGFPWELRPLNCYGPRGVVPSHVRALLAVCAGASRVKDGYASTAANTFQPLDRWRLVSSVAALRATKKDEATISSRLPTASSSCGAGRCPCAANATTSGRWCT